VNLYLTAASSSPEVVGVTSAYLGLLAGKDLLKLVCDEDGHVIKSLFYENVRDYLGLNPINQEIRSTLVSGVSDRFILMNNGRDYDYPEICKLRGDKFSVSDFQIVNGLPDEPRAALARGRSSCCNSRSLPPHSHTGRDGY